MTKKVDPKVHKTFTKAAQAKLEEARQNANRLYVYPTLNMRQAFILIECMHLGLEKGIIVDGVAVTADEYLELSKSLLK